MTLLSDMLVEFIIFLTILVGKSGRIFAIAAPFFGHGTASRISTSCWIWAYISLIGIWALFWARLWTKKFRVKKKKLNWYLITLPYLMLLKQSLFRLLTKHYVFLRLLSTAKLTKLWYLQEKLLIPISILIKSPSFQIWSSATDTTIQTRETKTSNGVYISLSTCTFTITQALATDIHSETKLQKIDKSGKLIGWSRPSIQVSRQHLFTHFPNIISLYLFYFILLFSIPSLSKTLIQIFLIDLSFRKKRLEAFSLSHLRPKPAFRFSLFKSRNWWVESSVDLFRLGFLKGFPFFFSVLICFVRLWKFSQETICGFLYTSVLVLRFKSAWFWI